MLKMVAYFFQLNPFANQLVVSNLGALNMVLIKSLRFVRRAMKSGIRKMREKSGSSIRFPLRVTDVSSRHILWVDWNEFGFTAWLCEVEADDTPSYVP